MKGFDPDTGHVYCILSSNGAVKIGMSTQPRHRIRGIASMMKVAGLKIERFEISRIAIRPLLIEQSIIENLEKKFDQVSGREWFTGVSYEEVARIVRSFHSTEEQIERYIVNAKREKLLRYEKWQKSRFSL